MLNVHLPQIPAEAGQQSRLLWTDQTNRTVRGFGTKSAQHTPPKITGEKRKDKKAEKTYRIWLYLLKGTVPKLGV